MTMSSPIDRQRCRLGPGLEGPAIEEALACLGRDPEVQTLVLFGSRARGEAGADSDLDLLISDAATAAHWAGSRWHVLGHIHREGVTLDVS
ncbi:MAG: nucleotidyltransferase family protein [Cyanobium sp.]